MRTTGLARGFTSMAGESGFAVDQYGSFDVHGATQKLSAADVQALVRYVESIE